MRKLVLILLIVVNLPASAVGQSQLPEVATWQGDIKGIPTWITVVPRGHAIPEQVRATEPWWKWGNTTTDAYIFAFDNPVNARMILEFRQHADGVPEARLYLNNKGRRPVDYALDGTRLTVKSHDGNPFLIIRPRQGTWIQEGHTNYNLDLLVDGPPTLFGYAKAPTDGVIDSKIVVASDQPGVPQRETTRLIYDPRPNDGYLRFSTGVRMKHAPPFKVAPPLMPPFPYFDVGSGKVRIAGEEQEQNEIDWFKENPNPIYFNVRGGELLMFPFVGFQEGGIYAASSISQPPHVDFESPFAFYNFDPSTRYAQIVLRASTFPAQSPFGPAARTAGNRDRTSFRYSWKTDDMTRWKYSLQVGGSEPYPEEVRVGEETFIGVSAERLPEWVATRRWPIVTFVEAVQGYGGSEGIYFYSSQDDNLWPWAVGLTNDPPDYFARPYLPETSRLTRTTSQSLPPGFRGEYNTAYFREPRLYMSPLDRRLHLMYASGGVWNIGDSQILRTQNLDGDAYIDGWVRERIPAPVDNADPPRAVQGSVEEALYTLRNYLIYSGPSGSEVRAVNYQPAEFEITPPTDKASWLSFRDRMAVYQAQERNPLDLRSWMAAFSGTTLLKSSGQISDVRTTADGFRFVVDLPGGAALDLPGHARQTAPGKYVVTYNGVWTIDPLTPAQLTLRLTLDAGPRAADGPLGVQAHITNSGLQDLTGLVAVATVEKNGRPVEVDRAPIDVLAGQSVRHLFSVQPAALDSDKLYVRLEPREGQPLVETSIALPPVESAAAPQRVASVSSGGMQWLPVVLFLALIGAVATALLWLVGNHRQAGAS